MNGVGVGEVLCWRCGTIPGAGFNVDSNLSPDPGIPQTALKVEERVLIRRNYTSRT